MSNSKKILYLGSNSGTSGHRARALSRLGYEVKVINPWLFLPRNFIISKLVSKWQRLLGGMIFEQHICNQVIKMLKGDAFDFTIVNCGELIGVPLVQELKNRSNYVINYNNDDPFGSRDQNHWSLYRQAVPYYDLLAVVREVNISEAYALGAKQVLRVFMTADEIVHSPKSIDVEEYKKWASEVLFIGTWMPERGPFMAELVKAGLPLSIYGNQWQAAREWSILRPAWRGEAIVEDDYAKAIQCSKLCLGLLSKGNRDLHTTRSVEIPSLGGVLCAERTAEHQQLYTEGKEAVFWSTPSECIEVCQLLLNNELRRKRMAKQGKSRALKNNLFNEEVMQEILKAALEETKDKYKQTII